jgi:hypothetical protein
MDFGRLILADPQPPEVVQPRQRPLREPAIPPQPTPVRRPPPRDVRTDAAPAQLPTMHVRVVAPIAIQAARPAARAARPAAHRWDRSVRPVNLTFRAVPGFATACLWARSRVHAAGRTMLR